MNITSGPDIAGFQKNKNKLIRPLKLDLIHLPSVYLM